MGYLLANDGELPVVGTFTARDPLTELDTGVVLAPAEPAAATTLYVVATSAASVRDAQALVLGVIAPAQADDLAVRSPTTLADLQGQIGADIGTFGRQLMLLVLGGGALLTAVVVLADVLVRRTDLGRRRALGATRGTVVALVVLRTAIAAVAGAIAGTTVGWLIAARWDTAPPGDFAAGTMILTVLTAVLAAVPPAVLAATRDPVQVLRTP